MLFEHQRRLIGSFPRLRLRKIDNGIVSSVRQSGIAIVDDGELILALAERNGKSSKSRGYVSDLSLLILVDALGTSENYKCPYQENSQC